VNAYASTEYTREEYDKYIARRTRLDFAAVRLAPPIEVFDVEFWKATKGMSWKENFCIRNYEFEVLGEFPELAGPQGEKVRANPCFARGYQPNLIKQEQFKLLPWPVTWTCGGGAYVECQGVTYMTIAFTSRDNPHWRDPSRYPEFEEVGNRYWFEDPIAKELWCHSLRRVYFLLKQVREY
jgi:hypothetical protein